MIWTALVTRAYAEIGVARAGDVLAPDLLEHGRVTLDLLLDLWNLKPSARYVSTFPTFTITPNHQPHTIGVTGADWTVATARPSQIRKANIYLVGTPNVRQQVDIRDNAWWEAERVPALTSTFPTDLYYEDDFPLGKCWLWPVPTTAYTIELELDTLFVPIDASSDSEAAGDNVLADDVALPAGYTAAVVFTLAEWLAASMGQSVSPKTEQLAREARAVTFDANDPVVRIRTSAGMPGSRSRSRTSFNYHSRQF